tara:strand:+ start:168 stop:329 length:162 start_codon:yes stop_codon:yes gene_type:complete
MKLGNHYDVSIECRKLPSSIINQDSLAKFPEILPKLHCVEYLERGKKYLGILP